MRLEIDPDRPLYVPAVAEADGMSYDLHDGRARAYTHPSHVTATGDLAWLKIRAGDLLADLAAQGVEVLTLDPSDGG